MRQLCTLTVLLVLALSSSTALAQKQYDIWYFGEGGLDFSTDPPTVLTDGQIQTPEGTANYCDPVTGELLFYTDGITVWNRNHQIMPNGQGLISDPSSTQAALIVPDPANGDRYYIFHTDQAHSISRGLFYSICDMSLSGGFGDIAQKNTPLLPTSTEKLTAIAHCDGQSYWIIAHERENNTFVVWLLDENGVSTEPIRSSIGEEHGPHFGAAVGYLIASPNGSMLVSAVYDGWVEIFRFDATTGTVYDPIQLPVLGSPYGASFSPDNTKVYTSTPQLIAQYDVTSWDRDIIAATEYRMAHSYNRHSALKLGPDRKLYVQHASHIGVIGKPNLGGAACEYVANAIPMTSANTYGLPNNIDALEGGKCRGPSAVIRSHRTNLCEGSCVDFADSSQRATRYLWTFEGATPSTSTDRNPTNICFATAGTYQVKLVVSNEYGSDSATSTIRIKLCQKPEITLRDTTICISECLTFRDTSQTSTTTQWLFEEGTPSSYTGKTPPAICYYRPGKHRVRVIASNEIGSDTAIAYVTVRDCDLPIAGFAHDTLICITQTLTLTDKTRNPVTSWEWAFEGGTPPTSTERHPKNITYSETGLYTIRLIASNTNGSDTSYSTVRVVECDPPVASLHNYEICEGDCIYLEDSSTNNPISWEWQLEGITPGLLTSAKPGQICYETPGRFSIQLISRNLYGADTVRSNVLVRPATGFITSSAYLLDTLDACSMIDTFFWVYAGCKDNLISSLSSDDPNIILPSASLTVRATDSLKVAVRILAGPPGSFTSNISFSLNGETIVLPCSYHVRPDKEKFTFGTLDTEFITTHCDALMREFTITNTACTKHAIRRVYLESSSGVTPFTLSYNTAALELPPEEILEIAVTYDPSAPGDTDPNLIVETAAGNKHTYPLQGVRRPLPEMSLGLRSSAQHVHAGDELGLELAFETAIGDTVLPSTVSVTLDYNTDVLSASKILPNNGWSLESSNETSGQLTMMFARQQRTAIAQGELLTQMTFKSFLAKEDSTTLVLSEITSNAGDPEFERCTMRVLPGDSTIITVSADCGENEMRYAMGKERMIVMTVHPNPLASREGVLHVTIETRLVGQHSISYHLDLVDVMGRSVRLHSDDLSFRRTLELTLPAGTSGLCILRLTSEYGTISMPLVIH